MTATRARREGHDWRCTCPLHGGCSLTLRDRSTFTFPSPLRGGGVEFWRVTSLRDPGGTMNAFFSMKRPSQMFLNSCNLMVSTTRRYWISMPFSRRLDKDENVATEPHGKRRYEQHAKFADRAAKNRFEELVLRALRETHPELFGGSAA